MWELDHKEGWSSAKKDLHDPDNHDGVITHLEPDILECEVKWALGSITMNKASGGDPRWAISNPERWCCESATLNMPANLENSAVSTGVEKVSFHSNPKERQWQWMLIAFWLIDGDCSHEIKRRLLPGRKVMTNLDSILKSRDIILPTKVRLVKAMVFPVVMYGCESWTVMKTERRRIDAFELWCWRRLLRVPWTARRSN